MGNGGLSFKVKSGLSGLPKKPIFVLLTLEFFYFFSCNSIRLLKQNDCLV